MDTSNPFTSAESLGYHVTPEIIERIAHANAAGTAVTDRVAGTYLRILVAGTQAIVTLNTGVADNIVNRASAFASVNANAYSAVLRGIATPDCVADKSLDRAENKRRSLERNRRSNFARTSATAVRAFIAAGGEIENVDVAVVTKSSLTQATAALRAGASVGGPVAFADPATVTATDVDARLRSAANRRWNSFRRALARLNDSDRATATKYAITQLETEV